MEASNSGRIKKTTFVVFLSIVMITVVRIMRIKEVSFHMELIRDVYLPTCGHFSIYADTPYQCVSKEVICGTVSLVYPKLSDGYHSIYNKDHLLFVLLEKRQDIVVIRSLDQVDFIHEKKNVFHSPLYSQQSLHVEASTENQTTFIQALYDENYNVTNIELATNLLPRLKRMHSYNFKVRELCSLFNLNTTIPFGRTSLFSHDYRVYVIFRYEPQKIIINELVRAEFFIEGISHNKK